MKIHVIELFHCTTLCYHSNIKIYIIHGLTNAGPMVQASGTTSIST